MIALGAVGAVGTAALLGAGSVVTAAQSAVTADSPGTTGSSTGSTQDGQSPTPLVSTGGSGSSHAQSSGS